MANMLVPTMALMLAVGPSNYILYKIAFTSYGASSALFAMQMVNLLFVVYGAVALYAVRGAITDEMRASSKVPYALMALLDCLGGLCAALGAARTPGQLQTLLSQSLVPPSLRPARWPRRLTCFQTDHGGSQSRRSQQLLGPALEQRAPIYDSA